MVDFEETITQINQIIELIRNPRIRIPRFLKAGRVRNLWYVMRSARWFGFWLESWEDCISSLMMIGPPGRAARFYNARDLWERDGAFEIVLGERR